MTSQLLSCWHLKSYRERLGMNGMTFVYLRLREASITNEQWYFAMVIITRGLIHVRDDRFSQFRNRKNLRSLKSFGKWHHNLLARATCPAKTSLIPSALPNVLLVMACPWIGLFSIVEIFLKKWCYGTWGNNQYRNLQAEVFFWSDTFLYCMWPASIPEVCRLRTVQLVLELCTVLALT